MLSLGGLNSGSLKDLQLVISFSTDFAIHTKVRGRAWSHCLGSIAKIELPMKVTIQFLLPLAPGGGIRLPPPIFLGQFTACSHPLSYIGRSFADAQSKLCCLSLLCFSLCCCFACGTHPLPSAGAVKGWTAELEEKDMAAPLWNNHCDVVIGHKLLKSLFVSLMFCTDVISSFSHSTIYLINHWTLF